MPKWPSALVESNDQDRRAIEEIARAISSYNLDTIRAAMQRYHDESWDKGHGIEADARLFVLNHYLFNMPATIRRDSPHFPMIFAPYAPISGEIGNPKSSDELDARWPWSVDKKGDWRLTGTDRGFIGLPTDPLRAFDYYRSHFGSRNSVSGRSKPARWAK
jgi:hypothetical protein